MNDSKLRDTFERDGFVVIRQFLPPAELAELQENLDRYIREIVPGLPPSAAFYHDRERPETLKQLQHMDHDAYFSAYKQNQRWLEAAAELLGEPAEVQSSEWFNKPPGTEHPTPPHQDNYYFSLTPPKVVTMWLALDTVDEENGCLRYVAGSHRDGLRPHGATEVLGFSQGVLDYGEADRRREVAAHCQPGDLVAHHGETIHRADANRSADRNRRSFALVCRGESCRRDEERYEQYLASLKTQHSAMGIQS